MSPCKPNYSNIFFSQVRSADDTIVLGGALTLGTTDLTAANATAAGTSAESIVYVQSTGALYYNANDTLPGFGTGGGQFAVLTGSPTLVA